MAGVVGIQGFTVKLGSDHVEVFFYGEDIGL